MQSCKKPRKSFSPPKWRKAGDASARPGDIFIPAWKRDRPAMMDIKVAAALCKARAASSALTPEEAARLGRIEKLRKHELLIIAYPAGWALLLS